MESNDLENEIRLLVREYSWMGFLQVTNLLPLVRRRLKLCAVNAPGSPLCCKWSAAHLDSKMDPS